MKKTVCTIIKLSILTIMVIIFGLLSIIKNDPIKAEYYSANIAASYISNASKFFSNIPFSVYELTVIFIIVMVIFFLVTILIKLFKKQYRKSGQRLLSFMIFVLTSVNIYFATASISYGRTEVKIPLYQETIDQQLVDEAMEYFIQDYNYLSTKFERNEDCTIISPYTFEEVNELIKKEYLRLDPTYFPEYTPKAKQLLFSFVFTELHFTGIFWAPTGEANINTNLHAVELPHTMAHEFAHSKGVFREGDANLVAMYITLTSENEYLRYSGYYNHFFSSLLRLYEKKPEQYRYYLSKLNPDIIKEVNAINKFWWEDHNLLEKIGDWYNDLFLKANGEEQGTDSYWDNTEFEDTGKVDENNQPIYIIPEYSTFSKLFFHIYKENNKN